MSESKNTTCKSDVSAKESDPQGNAILPIDVLQFQIGSFCPPITAFALSTTCTRLSNLKDWFDIDGAAKQLKDERVRTSLNLQRVNLISFQYALDQVCSICKNSYSGVFDACFGMYGHPACMSTLFVESSQMRRFNLSPEVLDNLPRRRLWSLSSGEDGVVHCYVGVRDWCFRKDWSLDSVVQDTKWKEKSAQVERSSAEAHAMYFFSVTQW